MEEDPEAIYIYIYKNIFISVCKRKKEGVRDREDKRLEGSLKVGIFPPEPKLSNHFYLMNDDDEC